MSIEKYILDFINEEFPAPYDTAREHRLRKKVEGLAKKLQGFTDPEAYGRGYKEGYDDAMDDIADSKE